jgi:hypothetical protein
LEQTASQIVAVNGVTPLMIETWFGIDQAKPRTIRVEADSERVPISLVLMALDPKSRQVFLRRTGVPASLETIKL